MPPPFTRQFLARKRGEHDGEPYDIKPCCINGVIGDGKVMLAVTPLATRPHFYWIRVDSTWLTMPYLHDVIDEVYEVRRICGRSRKLN